jgi:hypothetical protein
MPPVKAEMACSRTDETVSDLQVGLEEDHSCAVNHKHVSTIMDVLLVHVELQKALKKLSS